jgi:S-DNA-T family DNA segregation ATPase FtsK/SpoIIIE
MGVGATGAIDGTPSFPVGRDVTGRDHWLDLSDANTCHILVAGTTGSGKSEFLKSLIAALARKLGVGRIAFALIDPKQVTFNFADQTGPFLVHPVAHGTDEAIAIVKEAFNEAERRFAELKKRRLDDLAQWQAADKDAPPRLVLVFDEFADLMADRESKRELESPLKRLGAKARAAGIHLVLATQRPEASVVTPLVRSNLPARVCFRVASMADSKLILKSDDSADLLGRGDLIWQRAGGSIRLQSPFVERDELEATLFPRQGASVTL